MFQPELGTFHCVQVTLVLHYEAQSWFHKSTICHQGGSRESEQMGVLSKVK